MTTEHLFQGTLAWRGKVAGGMAGSLMIRSIERSERIYNAMLARGYQGQMRVLQEPTIESRDLLALAGGALFLAVLLAAPDARLPRAVLAGGAAE